MNYFSTIVSHILLSPLFAEANKAGSSSSAFNANAASSTPTNAQNNKAVTMKQQQQTGNMPLKNIKRSLVAISELLFFIYQGESCFRLFTAENILGVSIYVFELCQTSRCVFCWRKHFFFLFCFQWKIIDEYSQNKFIIPFTCFLIF